MNYKTMFAVEHYYVSDDCSTYEIFETLENAKEFCENKSNWNDDHFPLYIFKADFNLDRIYFDENGFWNYDDFSDTIIKYYSDFKITINLKPEI